MPKLVLPLITCTVLALVSGVSTVAQVTPTSEYLKPGSEQGDVPDAVLIRNARIFTGCSPDLIEGQDVFVAGPLISRIGADLEPPEFATVIDAGGKVLIPGLIDAHSHLFLPGIVLLALKRQVVS